MGSSMQIKASPATVIWERKHGLAAVPVYWLNTTHISARKLGHPCALHPCIDSELLHASWLCNIPFAAGRLGLGLGI